MGSDPRFGWWREVAAARIATPLSAWGSRLTRLHRLLHPPHDQPIRDRAHHEREEDRPLFGAARRPHRAGLNAVDDNENPVPQAYERRPDPCREGAAAKPSEEPRSTAPNPDKPPTQSTSRPAHRVRSLNRIAPTLDTL